MSGCVAAVIIAAGVGEDAIWMKLLVIVILAAGAGVYAVARKRGTIGTIKGYYRMQRPRYGGFERLKEAAKTAAQKWTGAFAGAAKHTTVAGDAQDGSAGSPQTGLDTKTPAEGTGKRFGADKKKDTGSGMEILAADFLVSVVERLDGDDRRDVDMRSFSFNEIVRRRELRAVESDALAVYAKDEHRLYGKRIQCEALKELTRRTGTQPQEENGKYSGVGHAERHKAQTDAGGHGFVQQ
jgi:hypothetical protein